MDQWSKIIILFLTIFTIVLWSGCRERNGSTQSDLIGKDANWSKGGEFEEKVSTYEDEDRHIWQKPDRVIKLLGNIEDKTVVDLGAGTGYFALKLLNKAKKVIALDIDPEFIDFLERKKALLTPSQQERFEVRMAKSNDPMLKDGEADAILLVNTYVYIPNRVQYFRNLRSKLSPGAKIVIIEFKMKDIPNGPPPAEKISLYDVERELKEAGYANILTDDTALDYQYIVTASIN